jgi:hypothetical protein
VEFNATCGGCDYQPVAYTTDANWDDIDHDAQVSVTKTQTGSAITHFLWRVKSTSSNYIINPISNFATYLDQPEKIFNSTVTSTVTNSTTPSQTTQSPISRDEIVRHEGQKVTDIETYVKIETIVSEEIYEPQTSRVSISMPTANTATTTVQVTEYVTDIDPWNYYSYPDSITLQATVSNYCADSFAETSIYFNRPATPVAQFVTCARNVSFNYATGSFNDVALDARDSYSPAGRSPLYYRYRKLQYPVLDTTSELLALTVSYGNWIPPTFGTYKIQAEVTDGVTIGISESTTVTAYW